MVKTSKTTTEPSADSTVPVKTKRKYTKRKKTKRELTTKIDLKKAVSLRIHNQLSYDQIAAQFGVTKQAVCKRLKPLMAVLDNPEATAIYRDNRADILDSVERVLTTHMVDTDKLKAASINNLAYAASQLNNIGRLERGQSTANVQVIAGLSENDREWLAKVCSQFAQRQLAEPDEDG